MDLCHGKDAAASPCGDLLLRIGDIPNGQLQGHNGALAQRVGARWPRAQVLAPGAAMPHVRYDALLFDDPEPHPSPLPRSRSRRLRILDAWDEMRQQQPGGREGRRAVADLASGGWEMAV